MPLTDSDAEVSPVVRTLTLPVRDGRPSDEAMRINADHIVMLEPVVARTTTTLVLRVRLKLRSSPVMDVWLGEFSDIDELDASWQTFLATMQRLVRLVALHVREGPEGAASTWINPDCIGVLQPILSTTGTTSVLGAQLKLEGLPLMDAWLGEFSDQATADAGWRSFLTEVHGDSPSAS